MGIIKVSLFFKLIVLTVLLLGSFSVVAQDNLLYTTIDNAKKMRDAGDLEQAADVLKKFNNQYPGNIWIQRLYAETLFWLNDYEEAILVYEEAINTHPDDFDVKYEYALMLFNVEEYSKARELLLVYVNKYPEVAEAETLLGTIDYYLGDFIPAVEHLEKSLELNPTDKNTAQLLKDVYLITKPWVNVNFAYNHDSQNITRLSPIIEGGIFKSAAFSPSFYLDLQNLSVDSTKSNQINFLIQNRFLFNKIGLKAKVGVGVNYNTNIQLTDLLWDIVLEQKITKKLSFIGGSRRSAYIYTVASLSNPLLSNKYNLSLEWNKQKSWWAKAGYLAEVFPDANNVQTYYAWALAPAIKFSIFELRLGYAFNYANSKESRFESVESKEDIINNWQEDEKIEGVYDPYFTPNNQFSNSALGIILITPSPKFNIKLHATVGFYAKTMNPYLYLDKTNSGKIEIIQDFYQESFTPMDLGINLNFDLSNNFNLNFSYDYLQTFYFNSNNLQLGLKMYF